MDTAEQFAPAAELAPQVDPGEAASDGQDTGSQADEQVAEAAIAAEAELVEIERNGKKYALPKELESELLMQSDYTRKAQEVAQQRAALEQNQQLFQQAVAVQRDLVQGMAHIASLDRELGQYANLDWNDLTARDAPGAQQAFIRYTQLKEARQQAAHAVSVREQQLAVNLDQSVAQAVGKSRERAEKEIPGWSPEVDKALATWVTKAGFSAQQAKAIAGDFTSVQTVWKAMKYDELVSKKPSAPAAPAQIAHVVRAKTNDAAPPESIEQWMKWRNSQIKRK